MEEFLAAVERHELTIIGFGFLLFWALVAAIRAARGKDDE